MNVQNSTIEGAKTLRDKQISELPQKTRSKVEVMQKHLAAGESDRLRGRWALGSEVHQIAAEPAKYGKSSIPKLASIRGCGRDLLDDAKYVYEVWPTKREFNALMKRKDKVRSQGISFQQAVEIAKAVKDEAKRRSSELDVTVRDEWVDKWRASGMSCRDLRKERSQKPPKVSPDSPVPRSVQSFFRSSRSNADSFNNALESDRVRIETLIVNDADAHNPDCLKSLREMKSSLEEQQKKLAKHIKFVEVQILKVADEVEHEFSERSENSKPGQEAVAA